jgi:hypothetical protein
MRQIALFRSKRSEPLLKRSLLFVNKSLPAIKRPLPFILAGLGLVLALVTTAGAVMLLKLDVPRPRMFGARPPTT